MIIWFRTYALALLSGLLMSWAFPRFHLHPLAWIALIPLVWKTAQATPWAAARQFYVCGLLFYLILLQWLMANIHWAGGWAVLGYFGLCLGLALFWGALGFAWGMAHKNSRRISGAVHLALLWVTMEWLQDFLFTGFPWGSLGHSQGASLALAQWAVIGGVGLLTFFVVLFNALLALAVREKAYRWARLGTAVAVLALTQGVGDALLGDADYETDPYRVGIYQSNYPQAMKWDRAYVVDMVERACRASERLAKHETLNAFIWPEALLVDHYEKGRLWQPLLTLVEKTGTPLVTGTVRLENAPNKYFNSSIHVNPQGEVMGYYDKVHLVPFGEYIPFARQLPFLNLVSGFGNLDIGAEQKLFEVQGRRLGPLICFEVLFGGQAEELRRMGADALVVMTNLAWFGGSNALSQELEIARLRAIETRLPLIHAANTGISGVFDPWGRFQPVGYGYGVGGEGRLRSAKLERVVAALDVPLPGKRPLPFSPRLFAWLAMMASVALFILSLALPEPPAAVPETPESGLLSDEARVEKPDESVVPTDGTP
jgi:apolipoprotein N-acyltransferase